METGQDFNLPFLALSNSDHPRASDAVLDDEDALEFTAVNDRFCRYDDRLMQSTRNAQPTE
jgi:hypothetical protein